MSPQTVTCCSCTQPFVRYDEELSFYERISPEILGKQFIVPPPELCRFCREQQRLAFRNERALYRGVCALTKRDIISIYSPDKPFIVYNQTAWWSDSYDPLSYGRDFDFSRTFFEQYSDLFRAVPKLAIQNAKSENCDYTNYSNENKNCYFAVGTTHCEDTYFSYRIFNSKNIVDCYDLNQAELCYECLESADIYDCQYCRKCQNCSSLRYCEDCVGCHNCYGCFNLRNKKFCYLNQQLSEADYNEAISHVSNSPKHFQSQLATLRAESPERAVWTINCENSSGDLLLNCQNCFEAYSFRESRDCRYVGNGFKATDCQDCNFFDECELQYFCTNAGPNYNVIFSYLVWDVSNSFYSSNCFNSKYLFGCTGMKKQEYCIFNKSYKKDEYFALLSRIVSHMQETGEWGKFFPISNSPFAYNETVAQELYPLTKETALARGFRWHEKDSRDYAPASYSPPHLITVVPDSIVREILACKLCSKNYRITSAELAFYRKLELRLPLKCPDCRHTARMNKRNLRHLSPHICSMCGAGINTTVRNSSSKKVYCESCFSANAG